MSDPDLRLGAFHYETTRALLDGQVSVEATNTSTGSGRTLPEVFLGLLREDRFDVSELGMTYYLRSLESDPRFIGIPAFPNRVFRHSCIFVNRRSGITEASDLIDRTIGEFGVYGQDSGVWAKGILMDEYGFRPDQNRWVIGGLEQPSPPFDFIEQIHPTGIDITTVADRSLGQMLLDGEIDALFSANVPQCVLDGADDVGLLFPDYEARERDFFRRTGIFPLMHTVAARRDLLEAQPGLASRVYDAFLTSKEMAADRYRQGRRLFQVPFMLPWTNALFDENRELFPDDWWPYGIEKNRATLDAYLRYHHEQGLSSRRFSIEEIFVPELLST